jgi:hypothetical protein
MAKRYFKFSETHRKFGRVKLKRCTKCKKWKQESEFHKDRARKDGLRLYCKDCCAAYIRERRRKEGKAVRGYLRFEERRRIVRGVKEKQCSRCQQWKYESDFGRNRRSKDKLSCWCKECANVQARTRLERRKKDVRRNLRYEDRHRVVNGVKEKLCTKCGEWKKESEYYKQRSSRDGLLGQCKECGNGQAGKRLERTKKEARRNLRYEDRHRVVNGVKEKLCTKCGEWKKESEYYKHRSSRDGLSVQCKRCSYKATKKSDKSGLAVRK